MPPPFSDRDRRELLAEARKAIVAAVVHHSLPDLPAYHGNLAEPRGAFVTLQRRGRLRGCIGRTTATTSLGETVSQCAIGAALNDPRFPPVGPQEVGELEIEISVMDTPAPITLEEIQPGVHGLLVIRGAQRGLLLPQVAAERHWTAERFLQETCRKAELDVDAWRDHDTQVLGFSVEAFSEAELREA